MDDVLPIINGDCEFATMDGKVHRINGEWDLLIAHPPCTDLAVSGARWFAEKRADGRQQRAIDFFMKFATCKCGMVAIENPVCIMSSVWRKPNQIIQPWQFGHGETKATCLWLKGIQKLEPTNIVNGREQKVWRMPPSENRAKERSKTFPGIARAFAEQWAGDARWFWEEMDMNEELFIEAEKMLFDGEGYCKNGCDNCKIKELGGFCAKERLEEWRDALK